MTDPISGAINTLSAAWRAPSVNVGDRVWSGQGTAMGSNPLASGALTPAPVGVQGWGLALNRGSDSYTRTPAWWGPQPEASAQSGTGSTTGTGATGSVSSPGGDWANVDKLNDLISRAATEAGVDPNQMKAIMKLESGGVWQTSPAGAIGYMQVMPFWGDDLGLDLNDPYQNILAGAKVLKTNLDESGGDFYEALRRYHGYGWDGYTTDTQYADTVTENFQDLQSFGGTPAIGTGGLSTIWGNTQDFPITQEMGMTAFASGNPLYDYAREYHNFQGHPGLDVGTPYGTQLYTPVSGTVIKAGGTGFYCSTNGCGPGQGEFRIQLDNGDQLILGHMSSIGVHEGDRISAGTMVGLSGNENGDHVHVEYRQADGSGGFYIADPRKVLGGTASVTGGTMGGGGNIPASGGFGQGWVNDFYSGLGG